MVIMELEVPDSFPDNLEKIREFNDIDSIVDVLPFLVKQEIQKIGDEEHKNKRLYEALEILEYIKASIGGKTSLKDLWLMIKDDFPTIAGKDHNNGYFIAVINAICLNYNFKNINVIRKSPLDIEFTPNPIQIDEDDEDLTNLGCLLEVLRVINTNRNKNVAYRDIYPHLRAKTKLTEDEYKKAWKMIIPDLFGDTSSWKLERSLKGKVSIVKE